MAWAAWCVAALLGLVELLVYTEAVSWMSPSVGVVLLGGSAIALTLTGAIVYGT